MDAPARLAAHFAPLTDPRHARGKGHRLLDALLIAIGAVICGADSWVEIEQFGKAKRVWLAGFLDVPNGIPSHDTFGRIFAALDGEHFQRCFLSWVRETVEQTNGQIIAVEGGMG